MLAVSLVDPDSDLPSQGGYLFLQMRFDRLLWAGGMVRLPDRP
jgi:hypothetical protein